MTPSSLSLHRASWLVAGKLWGAMTASCPAVSVLSWWSVRRYSIDTTADRGHSSSSSASSSPSAELLHHWQLLPARSQAEVLTTLGLFDGMFFIITLSVCMLCMLLAFIGFTKSESQKCNKSGNINDGYTYLNQLLPTPSLRNNHFT